MPVATNPFWSEIIKVQTISSRNCQDLINFKERFFFYGFSIFKKHSLIDSILWKNLTFTKIEYINSKQLHENRQMPRKNIQVSWSTIRVGVELPTILSCSCSKKLRFKKILIASISNSKQTKCHTIKKEEEK